MHGYVPGYARKSEAELQALIAKARNSNCKGKDTQSSQHRYGGNMDWSSSKKEQRRNIRHCSVRSAVREKLVVNDPGILHHKF